jgi:FkbM family methyltransferase
MKTNVHFLMSSIIESNLSVHKVSSDLYKRLKIYFKDYFKEHKNKKKSNLFFSLIGNFKLPYFKMGKINSSHLLGLDELIIFSFYKKLKILGYQKVADLGANIGLHSVILGKLNYQVRAYEPDPDHVKQFKKNIKINKLKKIKLIEKAVDIKEGSVIFNKILNNTTASFIGNAKLKTSGVVKKFIVRTENIKNILKWAQIIKMDIEGMEYKVIKTLIKKDIIGKIIILEIGTRTNAIRIFEHCKKNKIFLFSQITGWKLAKNISEVPFSHKDGSAILYYKNKFPI